MKILIYGAGVIGSIFAAKLSNSGQDVTVLARGKRFNEIQENGVIISNPKTKHTETAKVKVISELSYNIIYDYIFVVMQRTQVGAVLKNLSRNKTPNIVFVVNTASGYKEWEKELGQHRLIIGFPSAGGERKNGTVNYFIGKGFARLFQTTTFGEPNGKKSKRLAEITKMFRHSGIPAISSCNIDAWQKTHVAVVTSIANALYGHNCNSYALSESWLDVREMVLSIKEGFAILREIGVTPTPCKLSVFYLPTALVTFVFKVFMGTQLAEITMAKHCSVAKQEMVFLQNEFDKLIIKSGIPTPHINLLKQNLL